MPDIRLHSTPISLWQLIFRWTWFIIAFTLVLSCSSQTRPCQNAGDCLADEGCDWRKGSCIPKCQDNGDCLHAQRCHVALRVCLTVCNDDSGCAPEERCEPNDRVCVKTPCPTGVLPQNEQCPCQQQNDCPQDTYCDNFGNKAGMCYAVCPVSGAKPKNGVCPCPEGILWIHGLCVPPCPATMIRRHDGICVPDLPTSMPSAWEKTNDGQFRLKCPNSPYWKRDEKGQCQLQLPAIPQIPNISDFPGSPPSTEDLRKKVGPQKPCPADPNDKWDDDYLTREKIPVETPVVYVDSSASAGGNGTKQQPYRTLQEGVNQVATGSVVLIAPGTYEWGLKINKHLHLVGRCTDAVKITPVLGSSGAGVHLTGSGVNMEGFSLLGEGQALGYGISIEQTGFSRLQHIRVQQAHTNGIVVLGGQVELTNSEVSGIVQNSSNTGIVLHNLNKISIFRHNIIQNNGIYGIYASDTRDVVIEKNIIQDNGTPNNSGRGINLQGISGKISVLYNHISKNSEVGIFISRAQHTEIEGNLLQENGTQHNSGRGISLQGMIGKVIVSYNHINKNTHIGIFASDSQELKITSNWIQENGILRKIGNGIDLKRLTGNIAIRHNHIIKNATLGLHALSIQEIEINDNFFSGNGLSQAYSSGIELVTPEGKAIIQNNRIEKHASIGISIFQGQDVDIEGNHIEGTGTNTKQGQGIDLREVQGKILIRHNHIMKNSFLGIFVYFSNELEIDSNVIYENGTKNKEGRGINIEKLQKKALIHRNDVKQSGNIGIFVSLSQTVDIKENWVQGNGTPNQEGRGINLQGLQAKSTIRQNYIEKNAATGLFISNCQDVEIAGNFLLDNGSQHVDGKGIYLNQGLGLAFIHSNKILGNGKSGLDVNVCQHIGITHNLFQDNGIHVNDGSGMILGYVSGKADINNNTFERQPIGGFFAFSLHNSETHLSNNVWFGQHQMGLASFGNQGVTTLQSEQWIRNGNVHLRILNNLGPVTARQSFFIQGAFSKGLTHQGQGWSAGTGVELGAQGLVRWVFAKNVSSSCLLTQTKHILVGSDGWAMRLIRVPHHLDPCVDWRFGGSQTKFGHDKSLCRKKCGTTQQCRWVWKESEIGDTKNQALWKPWDITCVPKDSLNSCTTPIPASQALQSVSADFYVQGSCVTLPPEHDPCRSLTMQACNEHLDIFGKKDSFCSRQNHGLHQPWEAKCVPRHDTTEPCHPDVTEQSGHICDSGSVCAALMKVSEPMNVFPSQLTLQDSVFWNNPGPDVLMDMAGQVKLDNNSYHFCNPSPDNPSCQPKQAFRFCNPSPDDPSCQPAETPQRGYQRVFLPAGATLVWQNPSPYPDKAYESRISGNDRTRRSTGDLPLFYEPNSCNVLANQ